MQHSECAVSIVIPVYNTEEYLPACLDSVLAQTMGDFEAILVDDGSTDGSLAIERAYAARDPRLRVLEQPHLRQGAARNRGLAEARGEYVYFMDSDDVIEPELLEVCCGLCASRELDFVMFDCAGFLQVPGDAPELHDGTIFDRSSSCSQMITDGVSFWLDRFPKSQLPFVCWLQFFRRDFLLEHQLGFLEGIFYEDCDWILRAYIAARRIQYVSLALYHYRKRDGSVVNSGFGKTHAKSCLAIHSALSSMIDSCMQSQQQMVLDTSRIIDYSLDRFCEIDPDDDLLDCFDQFEKDLLRIICDDSSTICRKHLELNSLLHLGAAVVSWPIDKPVISRESFAKLVFPDLPLSFSGARIGVYGTGKISSLLMDNLEFEGASLVFLATDADSGASFRSRPIIPIDRAGKLGLDFIIIASTRYHADMEAMARRFSQSASLIVPDVVATRMLLRLVEAGDVRIEG